MRGFGHANRCVTDLGAEKLCCTCHEWWPADAEFFARNRARPDGLSSQCKACVAAHDRDARGPAAPAPLPVPAVFNISLRGTA